MPNEMNHADHKSLALSLAHIALVMNDLSLLEIHVITQAATDERRIANGELAPAPVKCGKCTFSEYNVNFKYCHKIHAFVPNDFGCICGERKDSGEK